MQQNTMETMKSYPGFPVLLDMMDKNFSSLTIDTAVSTMAMHSNPQQAAKMLMECLRKPEVTEKEFWRYLQEKVMVGTIFRTSSAQTP